MNSDAEGVEVKHLRMQQVLTQDRRLHRLAAAAAAGNAAAAAAAATRRREAFVVQSEKGERGASVAVSVCRLREQAKWSNNYLRANKIMGTQVSRYYRNTFELIIYAKSNTSICFLRPRAPALGEGSAFRRRAAA